MTGFGTAVAEFNNLSITVEIKSLNSKFLDLNMRLSKEYSDREIEIRNLFSNTLERGKVSLQVDVQVNGEVKPKLSINKELVKLYYQDLVDTAKSVGAPTDDLFRMALGMPKAMDADSENADNSEEWVKILKVLNEAIRKCDEFRIDEGKKLEEKFVEYIETIRGLLAKVEEQDPKRTQNVRDKIRNHITEHLSDTKFDEDRFEQELIYYIEKLDISEEKVRLKTHLDYFIETLRLPDSNGKKIGFIAQEIGREINTIGSKANDATIQRYVVQMKEELEKIKEQSLNIL